MLNGHPGGSVYKDAVLKTREGECQGRQDRLTEIALEFADAGEQALFLRNPHALRCDEGGRAGQRCLTR